MLFVVVGVLCCVCCLILFDVSDVLLRWCFECCLCLMLFYLMLCFRCVFSFVLCWFVFEFALFVFV